MISLFKPSITNEEIEAVIEVLKSGWWSLGKKTERFEKKFAKFVVSKYAVGVNSGTSALHYSLVALGINEGEIIVPALTFVSTALVAKYLKARIVFCDVDEETLTLDPKDLERKISKKTKAIIPVHMGGHPAQMDEIKEVANKIPVIEDCAHATGAYFKDKHVGSLGTFGAFSFHPVKNLATPDGGMIVTNSKIHYQKLIKLRWFGTDESTWNRAKHKTHSWNYNITETGFHGYLNDVAAAIGIVQLKRLKELNKRRKEVAQIYTKELSNLAWLKLPQEKPWATSSWHMYIIRTKFRDKLFESLTKNEISSSVHYRPLNTYPKVFPKVKLKITDRIWKTLLTLPIHPGLTNMDLEKIISTVKKVSV